LSYSLSPVYKTKRVEEVSSKGNLLEQQDEILKMISLNNPVCLPWKEDIIYPKISNAKLNNILVNLYSTGNIYAGSAYARFIPGRSLKEESDDVMQILLSKFKDNCMIDSADLSIDLPKNDSLERLLYSEVSAKEFKMQTDCSIGITEFIQNELEGASPSFEHFTVPKSCRFFYFYCCVFC
jgi:hypothetical protein